MVVPKKVAAFLLVLDNFVDDWIVTVRHDRLQRGSILKDLPQLAQTLRVTTSLGRNVSGLTVNEHRFRQEHFYFLEELTSGLRRKARHANRDYGCCRPAFANVDSEICIAIAFLARNSEPPSNFVEIDLSVNVVFQRFGFHNALRSTRNR